MVQCRGKSLYMYSTYRNYNCNSDISAAFSLSTAPNETCGITCEEFELPISHFDITTTSNSDVIVGGIKTHDHKGLEQACSSATTVRVLFSGQLE